MTIYKGRRLILSEYNLAETSSPDVIVDIVNNSFDTHLLNKSEIEYLTNYRAGVQPILDKEKLIRPEINNKVVINHAQMITRNIIGYFLGTPIQYIQNGTTKNKAGVDYLNVVTSYEDKPSVDKEIGEFQSICGTAYRIVYTDGLYGDEVPFENRALDPATTFVVYENSISNRPLVGVTYYDKDASIGMEIGRVVYAYTNFGVYEFDMDTSTNSVNKESMTFTPYDVGGVPIIEYPNNRWRIGDWELCLGLMDAINALHSGRFDDIDQTVQSLIAFINADIDEASYKAMREAGALSLTNKTAMKSDIKTIDQNLDHSGMNLFADELEQLLYAMVGVPDRKTRGGGGGDTGQAVELRDGWADLEIIARNKELSFRKAEKQSLKIMLKILSNKTDHAVSLIEVDVKFSRNKANNLLVKAQGYANLLATKTLDPSDCLTIVDLVSDVEEYISRGKAFWGDQFANQTPEVDPNADPNNTQEPKKEEKPNENN